VIDWWLPVALIACLVLLVLAFLRIGQQRRDATLRALELHLQTDRLKDAREENSFLTAINRSFVDQGRAAMLLLDGASKLRYFNPAAARLFNLSGPAQGKPLIEAIHDHDLNMLAQNTLRTSKAAQKSEFRPIGTELLLQATADPIRNDAGELLGVTVVIEDLTELHRLEIVRREFVANISHELRAPIAAVKAMVETLQSGALEDHRVALDFLNKIEHELDSTTFLVRDLLELSRIESGHLTLEFETVDARDIVRETVNRLQPTAEQAGLTLRHLDDGPLDVSTDRRRASQVLANLVENAIKFTPVGTVTVRSRKLASEAHISVEDTGMGISEDDLPRVFERFYKGDRARSRQDNPGTGLGLAIAKHLTQALNGRIWAGSQEGRGSTFSFTLPLAAPGAHPNGTTFGAREMALQGDSHA